MNANNDAPERIISNLRRNIHYLKKEIRLACDMLGCEHPDDFLPTLRRTLERLHEKEIGRAGA